MATWKQLHDIAKCELEIDLDTIEFMQRNGNGSEIHFNNGRTLTVRESPRDIRKNSSRASGVS
jgi:nitrogen fixation protein